MFIFSPTNANEREKFSRYEYFVQYFTKPSDAKIGLNLMKIDISLAQMVELNEPISASETYRNESWRVKARDCLNCRVEIHFILLCVGIEHRRFCITILSFCTHTLRHTNTHNFCLSTLKSKCDIYILIRMWLLLDNK